MNIEAQFNLIAEEYDCNRRKFIPCFDDYYENSTKFIISSIKKPKKVLDLGAGTGLIDERIKKLKERRPTGRIATADGADAGRTRPERPDYPGTESAARRIADLEREVKQREQNREYSSLKERLEENKRIIAERERENAYRKGHDRGMSR